MLKENERLDDLQKSNLFIIQDTSKFCFGMDAVLLSGFAKANSKDKVIDLGTGNGIIPLLLSAKTNATKIVGLEIQSEVASLAKRNVDLNELENKIEIVEGNIKDAASIFGKGSFQVVTSNPPYMVGTHGIKSEDEPRMIARHELLCSLEDVISSASKLLVPQGHFYMVHRPFRLAEIIAKMKMYNLEPKRMRLVYPFIDKEPNMLLIEGVKGGNERITIEKPLIVYKDKDVYTDEIYEIYGY